MDFSDVERKRRTCTIINEDVSKKDLWLGKEKGWMG